MGSDVLGALAPLAALATLAAPAYHAGPDGWCPSYAPRMDAPEHDLRWHAARLRAMGRFLDADTLGDLSPLPSGRSSGTLSSAMNAELDPVFRRTLAHRENVPDGSAGTVISCRRENRAKPLR